jgi:hypothetical protein
MKNYTIGVNIQSTLRLDIFERMRFGWALARLSAVVCYTYPAGIGGFWSR